jgi:hypothetical protein
MFDVSVDPMTAVIQFLIIGVLGIHQSEFYRHRQGRVEGNNPGQLNPNAQRFDPHVGATPSNQNMNNRSHDSGAHALNN